MSESEEREDEDPEGVTVDSKLLICPSGGLFMVLRARWILCGEGDTEGDEEATAEEEEGAGPMKDLLLPGPETLIFARPGDNAEEVEGEEEEEGEEADVDGRDFAACPAAGLFGEDAGDLFSPSSPVLEQSFPGC